MAKEFPDVDYNMWYGEAVRRVSDAGLMVGDDKGEFRPNAPLTRAEAAVLVERLMDLFAGGGGK